MGQEPAMEQGEHKVMKGRDRDFRVILQQAQGLTRETEVKERPARVGPCHVFHLVHVELF